MQLTEQYRPNELDQIVGQDELVTKIKALSLRGLGGRAYWLSGKSGTGKTTIARILARQVAGALATNETNAKDVDLDYIRAMEKCWTTTVLPSKGSDKNGRAWIFNEAQNLRASVCERLLTTLEEIPAHVVIVFTTTLKEETGLFENYEGAPAFMSRQIKLKLSERGLAEAFAKRASEIADKEGLNGRDSKWYLELVKQHRNNFRSVLNAIENGEALAA